MIRLSSGAFEISNAKTIEEISLDPNSAVLNLEYPLGAFLRLDVPQKYYKMLYNGVKISNICDLSSNMVDIVQYKVYCKDEFFGLGKFVDNKLVLNYRLID